MQKNSAKWIDQKKVQKNFDRHFKVSPFQLNLEKMNPGPYEHPYNCQLLVFVPGPPPWQKFEAPMSCIQNFLDIIKYTLE